MSSLCKPAYPASCARSRRRKPSVRTTDKLICDGAMSRLTHDSAMSRLTHAVAERAIARCTPGKRSTDD